MDVKDRKGNLFIAMDQKELAKRSNLMKLEAMALFAGVKANAASDRWWYFREMRRVGRPVRLDQSLSAYRASLFWNYLFLGIDCQVYLEREAHVGRQGEDLWILSFSSIEGKQHAQIIEEHLKPLQEKGFYIPNGNENLDRQMNFSLGLYGDCLMRVDVHFPSNRPPLPCLLEVLDLMEDYNMSQSESIEKILNDLDNKRASALAQDEEEDPDIIMGDWQTWK